MRASLCPTFKEEFQNVILKLKKLNEGVKSMNRVTLNNWIEELRSRFDERELKYMSAHKAKIWLQLKDTETGELHLHEIEYQSKDAEHLTIL